MPTLPTGGIPPPSPVPRATRPFDFAEGTGNAISGGGTQGPQGPTGPAGPPGPQGAAGSLVGAVRNTSALPTTAAANESTILTGSTGAQTLTLPPAGTPPGTLNAVTNLASVSVSVAAGTGTTLNYMGTVGTLTVVPKQGILVQLVGTVWYVLEATYTTAGGDLSGTYPNPTAARLNGIAASAYALLASPAFTGTPTAPTAAPGTSTTQLATTAFVAGATGAMVLLASTVLSSPAATLDFTSISGSYNHLRLLVLGRVSEAAESQACHVTFNNDSGSNYDFSGVNQTGTSAPGASEAAGQSFLTNFVCPGASATAGVAGYMDMTIPFYAQTTFKKVASYTTGWNDQFANVIDGAWYGQSGAWRNTAAINRVTITDGGGGNFVTGSAAYLYGIT